MNNLGGRISGGQVGITAVGVIKSGLGAWTLNDAAVPSGRSPAADFAIFGRNVPSNLASVGLKDIEPIMQGSAVTGRVTRPAKYSELGGLVILISRWQAHRC
ncbi:MAG: hypothetical protein EOP77_00760 [Variovorax sp.]|nr:MAG: hypothetical protein EOP77_00760 [Variovorax sp.]